MLLKTLLSLSLTSADAEREFSNMNYVKDERRVYLYPDNLDASMRIRYQDIEDVAEFDSTNFALKWLELYKEPGST